MSALANIIMAQLLPDGTNIEDMQKATLTFLTKLSDTMKAVEIIEKNIEIIMLSQNNILGAYVQINERLTEIEARLNQLGQ